MRPIDVQKNVMLRLLWQPWEREMGQEGEWGARQIRSDNTTERERRPGPLSLLRQCKLGGSREFLTA